MSLPFTLMWSFSGSALVPSSLTTAPLTVTLPATISSSACLREATPAAAISFCRRCSIVLCTLFFVLGALLQRTKYKALRTKSFSSHHLNRGNLRRLATQTNLSIRIEAETLSTFRTSSDVQPPLCVPLPQSTSCPATSLSTTVIARHEFRGSREQLQVAGKQSRQVSRGTRW